MTAVILRADVPRRYVIDANIFIASWRDYYPIDLYPGFWECLKDFCMKGRLLSIDRVREQISSPDELVTWVDKHWRGSFRTTEDPKVVKVFLSERCLLWETQRDALLPKLVSGEVRVADVMEMV